MTHTSRLLKLTVKRHTCPLKTPFRITGYTFTEKESIMVSLKQEGYVGRGEASGVYYRGDTIDHMVEQIESVRSSIEAGISRADLQKLLPAAGARNALDCAMWDLEAKRSGKAAWQIAKINRPRPLVTTFTCGAEDPETMAQMALDYSGAKAIKLKLTGEPLDIERVKAVRAACPGVWLGVDANQGFTPEFLQEVMNSFLEARVELIEQPFPVGKEADLDNFNSPIPIAADESLQGLESLSALQKRFSVINIKLDKCGGLTEGLIIAREAKKLGMQVMVGNMTGTSLAMAPSFIVGQLCDIVDLDGPALLAKDCKNPVQYINGEITCPEALWGGVASD